MYILLDLMPQAPSLVPWFGVQLDLELFFVSFLNVALSVVPDISIYIELFV